MTFIHESDNPEELLSIWEKENKDASIFESDEVNFFSGEQNTAKGSLFLAVEYSFIQYYLANKPSIKLLALYLREALLSFKSRLLICIKKMVSYCIHLGVKINNSNFSFVVITLINC